MKRAFLPEESTAVEPETDKKSDTLVLHPGDPSTDFLKPIYAGRGYDVLQTYQGDIGQLLPQYQRIIMMGHGWTEGLFSLGKLQNRKSPGLAVSSKDIKALKGKDNVHIWCMARTFVEAHGLKGFTTGMFISEVAEAGWFKIATTQEAINYSNDLFAQVMSKQIDNPNLKAIVEEYDGDCPVIQYNRNVMRKY